MYIFSKENVENAINGVCSKLDVKINSKLVEEYENGKHPDLLMYEKLQKPTLSIPAIQKYLISSQSFLDQPCQYYDIFRACRHVIFIQVLNEALKSAMDIENHQVKFDILRNTKSYESFESCLFELAVAHGYFSNEEVSGARFLKESKNESPDLDIELNKRRLYVECKKYNRSNDLIFAIRNKVREKVNPLLNAFREVRESAVIELSFHTYPQLIHSELILRNSKESHNSHCPIIDADFTVYVKPLKYQKLKEYVLHPSPKYFWERYGYKERGEWFGLVHNMIARHAHYKKNEKLWKELASTWLDDVDWECAVKWKITGDEVITRLRKLNYKRIFKGLSQLESCSPNSSLHVWLERDYSLGHRQEEMLDFFDKIRFSARDLFSWILFNETCLDVSPQGSFDLIEHCHIISGPSARGRNPLVTNVFTKENEVDGLGEFGIGHDLPEIDSI